MWTMKSIPTILVYAHNDLSAKFWKNHDIENCAVCQEAIKDDQNAK